MSAFAYLLALLAGACSVFFIVSEWLARRGAEQNRKQSRIRMGFAQVSLEPLLTRLPFAPLREKRAQAQLVMSYERDLPAMLEIIALGMHAGMGFDQAFELYAQRYDTSLARICRDSHKIWQRGLTSREKGMRELSERIALPSFSRFTSTALRALRFGAPMTQLLDDLAQETRREYRAKREEMVAKAPVKMLLPTGGLILPAMLLLVMGPILLDLIGKIG